MKKPTVAVIFGSRSAEHDVSVVTAISSIIKPLELTGKYNVLPVYIAKDGKWYADQKLKDIQLYSGGGIDGFLAKLKPVAVQFAGRMKIIKPGLKSSTIAIDIVFPATHGTFGEDGYLMGLLEMANVPYVGCNVAASVLAMDKVLSKIIAQSHGIATPKMQFTATQAYADEPESFIKNVVSTLKYPLFVKPAHLGSSIAITRVVNETELKNAIELAAHYDDKVLVEEAVGNLVEVTVPIMGNDELTVANTEEPIQGDAFFDFETKYMNQGKGKSGKAGSSKQGAQGYSHLPARLSDELREQCITTATGVYRALGCSGLARIDLLLDSKTKQVYFNEVNPLPGSLYAHNWRSIGISNIELVQRLIDLALERHAQREQYITTFETNFLKQF